MSKYKHLIKDIPFFMLLLNGISILILSFADPIDYSAPVHIRNAQYVQHMNDYDFIYSFLSEISGFSIPVIAFMAFYAYVHRYCPYSWVCIIGLGLLNVLNLAHYFCNFDYIQWYAGLIILPCVIFYYIYAIRKH